MDSISVLLLCDAFIDRLRAIEAPGIGHRPHWAYPARLRSTCLITFVSEPRRKSVQNLFNYSELTRM